MEKEKFEFKITKEAEEVWVRLDIEIAPNTRNLLEAYAEKTMSATERSDMLINWAFNKIIKMAVKPKRRR